MNYEVRMSDLVEMNCICCKDSWLADAKSPGACKCGRPGTPKDPEVVRVWSVAHCFRGSIEVAIAMAIGEGLHEEDIATILDSQVAALPLPKEPEEGPELTAQALLQAWKKK